MHDHRIALLLLIVAVLAFGAAPATAGDGSPLWGQLEPGPYAVGFRQIERSDHSRLHRLPVDMTGTAVAGERSRPLRISVWYPAEPGAGAPLTLGDYITLLGAEGHLGPVTAADAEAGRRDLYPWFRGKRMESAVPSRSRGRSQAHRGPKSRV